MTGTSLCFVVSRVSVVTAMAASENKVPKRSPPTWPGVVASPPELESNPVPEEPIENGAGKVAFVVSTRPSSPQPNPAS